MLPEPWEQMPCLAHHITWKGGGRHLSLPLPMILDNGRVWSPFLERMFQEISGCHDDAGESLLLCQNQRCCKHFSVCRIAHTAPPLVCRKEMLQASQCVQDSPHSTPVSVGGTRDAASILGCVGQPHTAQDCPDQNAYSDLIRNQTLSLISHGLREAQHEKKSHSEETAKKCAQE